MDDSTRNILTVILASYAALVSTTVLLWDLYKWRVSKTPNLVITANGGMVSTERRDRNTYISVRVVNIGEKAVKLHLISYEFYKNKPSKFNKRKPDEIGLFNLFGSQMVSAPLPHKIEVGEDWTGFLIQTEELEQKVKEGFFYILANDSSTQATKKIARTHLILSEALKDKN